MNKPLKIKNKPYKWGFFEYLYCFGMLAGISFFLVDIVTNRGAWPLVDIVYTGVMVALLDREQKINTGEFNGN